MQRPPVPGSFVWLRQRRWRVTRARAERRVIRLDVSRRSDRLTVLTPYDQPRLLAPNHRVVRLRRQQAVARLAHLAGAAPNARLAHAAIESRTDIWPHQLEPVLAVLDGRRRLLIADDVGLGKTIQAGFILAEVLRRQPMARALVIAPAGLTSQWSDELRHRFAIDARRVADAGLEQAAVAHGWGRNPWTRPGVWIASVDYLKQRHVLGGMPPEPWDVVVVDEAHGVAGRSDRHDACDELGRRARHFVLLSATPHDGDAGRFARLLRLGSLPYADDQLVVFRRTRPDVSLPHHRVVRWVRLRPTAALTRLLDTLEAFERAVVASSRPHTHDAALLLLAVLRKRALSTVAAFDRTLARRLEWITSSPSAERPDWYQRPLDFGEDDIDDEDRTWLTADVGMPRARERAWLSRLRTMATTLKGREPKVRRLLDLVGRCGEPVLIFTEFRHSLEELQRHLIGVRPAAVIHGAQSDPIRQRELGRFLSGDASVLIATDVGSQGLNLQARARWLINLELPWNPTRLEQRIGRLDRLGQARRVHATLLVTDHRAERNILESMARRTVTARQGLGSTTLADVAPPAHLMVASALFEGRRIDATPPLLAPVPICHALRRRGRALAVVTRRRRLLVRRWRSPAPPGGRPVFARLPFAGAINNLRLVVVLSAPIIDGTGEVIERRLLAIGLPSHEGCGAGVEALAREGRRRIAVHVTRRMRRLQFASALPSRYRTAAERAITRHLRAVTHPGEVQLGLFSQRAATMAVQARAREAIASHMADARQGLEAAHQHLTAGAATVEWIGERQ